MRLQRKFNPWNELRKEMKPLGARLETGIVTATDSVNVTVTVKIGGGTIPNVPITGGTMPSVSDRIWVIRQGSTLLALGKTTIP